MVLDSKMDVFFCYLTRWEGVGGIGWRRGEIRVFVYFFVEKFLSSSRSKRTVSVISLINILYILRRYNWG